MTAIVGIFCRNGVVVGTDSSATFGLKQFHTVEQQTAKISLIEKSIIVASTGAVGFAQRFASIIEAVWKTAPKDNVFHQTNSVTDVGVNLSRFFIENLAQSHCKPGQFGSLVAFPWKNRPYLCEFGQDDFQPELKDERIWYCSMGSTLPITDPFLGFIRDVFWQDGQPELQEGIFAATWTLEHAIDLNPGGVKGPAQIAILENRKGTPNARLLDDQELDQHRQHIEAAKEHLRSFKKLYGKEEISKAADSPKRE